MATAARTVQVNLVANAGGASAAFKKLGDDSEAAGKRAGKAFDGVLSTLNSSGVLGPFGESLEKITGLIDGIGEHGKAVGAKLMGLGAAGAGIGGILTAAAGPDQAALQQLQQQIKQSGGNYDDYKDNIESVVKANEKFGTTANESYDAIRILTAATGDTNKSMGMMATTANLAAAKHESLTAAANDMVKVYEGKGTKILTQFGLATNNVTGETKALASATIKSEAADTALSDAQKKLSEVHAELAGKTNLTAAEQTKLQNAQDKVTKATQASEDAHKKLTMAQGGATEAAKGQSGVLDQLGQKLSGQAAAASDTFTGKLKAMRAEIEDGAAKLGQKYGPAIMTVSTGITALGGVMEGAGAIMGKFSKVTKDGAGAQDLLNTAEDEGAVSEGLVLGPILLIVAAAAALALGIYELWTHWSQIWGWIKNVVSDVWGWIKQNWPLLLGILTGPIGLAVLEITRHWDDIKKAFGAVKDWIGDRVDDIVGFFTGLPGRIGKAVAHAFDALVDAFKGAVGNMLKAIPGSGIAGAVLGKIGDVLPHFAAGGSIAGGQLAVVGEHGPELFVPGMSGAIIPGGALSGGGGNVTVGQIVVNGASDPAAVAVAVRSEIIRMKRSNVNGGLS